MFIVTAAVYSTRIPRMRASHFVLHASNLTSLSIHTFSNPSFTDFADSYPSRSDPGGVSPNPFRSLTPHTFGWSSATSIMSWVTVAPLQKLDFVFVLKLGKTYRSSKQVMAANFLIMQNVPMPVTAPG